MILGIGCDIIEVDRIRLAISRHGDRFLERLFTPHELVYCQRHSSPLTSFAGRFVAKEALVKALGCGIGSSCGWLDIEIYNEPSGKPAVRWFIDVYSQFQVVHTHLSISHSSTVAIAYATVENGSL